MKAINTNPNLDWAIYLTADMVDDTLKAVVENTALRLRGLHLGWLRPLHKTGAWLVSERCFDSDRTAVGFVRLEAVNKTIHLQFHNEIQVEI